MAFVTDTHKIGPETICTRNTGDSLAPRRIILLRSPVHLSDNNRSLLANGHDFVVPATFEVSIGFIHVTAVVSAVIPTGIAVYGITDIISFDRILLKRTV